MIIFPFDPAHAEPAGHGVHTVWLPSEYDPVTGTHVTLGAKVVRGHAMSTGHGVHATALPKA